MICFRERCRLYILSCLAAIAWNCNWCHWSSYDRCTSSSSAGTSLKKSHFSGRRFLKKFSKLEGWLQIVKKWLGFKPICIGLGYTSASLLPNSFRGWDYVLPKQRRKKKLCQEESQRLNVERLLHKSNTEFRLISSDTASNNITTFYIDILKNDLYNINPIFNRWYSLSGWNFPPLKNLTLKCLSSQFRQMIHDDPQALNQVWKTYLGRCSSSVLVDDWGPGSSD